MSRPRVRSQHQSSTILIIILAALALMGAGMLAVLYWPEADYAFPGDPQLEPDPAKPVPVPAQPPEPFWPEPPLIPRPRNVKGIFITADTLQQERFANLVSLVAQTELNAMVIDLKDDAGRLTYNRTLVPWAEDAGAASYYEIDPVELVAFLADNDIYPIARIVAFKDNIIVHHRPDLAIHDSRGGLWRDGGGAYWLDPYNKESWKYVVALAREAAEMGFREIQFDYVRFPSDGRLSHIVYPSRDDTPFNQVIPDFLRYARASLEEYEVEISADIFGLVPADPTGMGIGQHFESIASEVDLVCPMIYPSHYGAGNLGIADPDAAPYETVYRTLNEGLRRLKNAGLNTAIRPWLQSFTIRHSYGAAEIRAQIQAAEDLGIHEFLLWNMGNYYNRASLRSADK